MVFSLAPLLECRTVVIFGFFAAAVCGQMCSGLANASNPAIFESLIVLFLLKHGNFGHPDESKLSINQGDIF
jgi:hypothetical protein